MKTALIIAVINLVILSIYLMLKKLLKEWEQTERSGNDPHDMFYH